MPARALQRSPRHLHAAHVRVPAGRRVTAPPTTSNRELPGESHVYRRRREALYRFRTRSRPATSRRRRCGRSGRPCHAWAISARHLRTDSVRASDESRPIHTAPPVCAPIRPCRCRAPPAPHHSPPARQTRRCFRLEFWTGHTRCGPGRKIRCRWCSRKRVRACWFCRRPTRPRRSRVPRRVHQLEVRRRGALPFPRRSACPRSRCCP